MINTEKFGLQLRKWGFDFYTGVPCSFLQPLINYAMNECNYVMASNEGDAIAIASGAYLGGVKSVVLMQNSGLANAVSPLTSLNYSFKLPVLGFVSLRGEYGLDDEPQHELMGKITCELLDLLDIEYDFLSDDLDEAIIQLREANELIESNKTFFFVVKKNTFSKLKLTTQNNNIEELPTRFSALKVILKHADINTIFLATTGFTGRELYEIEDKENNFYMVGSMGCVSSIGLGLALSKKNKNIIAIDGDGALIMRMGCLATNGYYAPDNLLHILLDNNCHDSTGGQFTVSDNVKFTEVAKNSGYRYAYIANSVEELDYYINKFKKDKSLTFIYLKIQKGAKENLARPKVKPFEVKERLINFIKKY